ncbi:MAG: hypothetical protein RL514_4701 [Verrucomicrobiota bacterium]|jgi:hypothetical protein
MRFKGQEWDTGWRMPEMSFQLEHPATAGRPLWWHFEAPFQPEGFDSMRAPYESVEHLYLDVCGHWPAGTDWREFEGKVFEPGEKFWNGPVIRVNSHGPGNAQWMGPDTHACMIRFLGRDGWKFQVEVSAWFTREASMLWQVRQLSRLVTADGEEEEEELPEEWRDSRDLYWVGEVLFSEVRCLVPVNSARPLELAQGLAGKSLKLSKFRKAALNADSSKPVTPESGLCCDGRLVLLTTPYF